MAVGTSLLYAYTASTIKKRQSKSDDSSKWHVLALAALATVSMVPFTWLVMVPTNNELFRLQRESVVNADVMGFEEARGLVVSWSWMHLTRSLLPLVGAVLGASATVRA
jgi:hypothetical protein